MPGSRLVASENHIDVWLAFYDEIADEQLLSRLRTLLSYPERLKEPRFYFADDQKRYLITRAMVRTVLSHYVDIAPGEWIFSENRYGRPQIANPGDEAHALSFNVSHTRTLIALGISRRRELGVDVENISTRQASLGIADRFFAPLEVTELGRVHPDLQHERFFEYWTFKESYIKARGMGLSIPLDQFAFDYPHEHGVRIAIEPVLGDEAARWCFWQFRPTPEYLLAICAERLGEGATSLTIRKVVPSVTEEILESQVTRCSE